MTLILNTVNVQDNNVKLEFKKPSHVVILCHSVCFNVAQIFRTMFM